MLSDELLHRIRLRAEDAQTRTDLLYNVDLGSKLIARATQNQVSAAESELGFQLPRDLVDLYLGVANGGFGPGCGIIGLFGGWTDDQGATLVSLYLDRIQRRKRKDPDWRWPERLVPFCYLGCASYSCIDCNSESARVVAADSEIEEWPEESSNLRDWIAAWAAGEDMGERYRAVVSPFYPARFSVAIVRFRPRSRVHSARLNSSAYLSPSGRRWRGWRGRGSRQAQARGAGA